MSASPTSPLYVGKHSNIGNLGKILFRTVKSIKIIFSNLASVRLDFKKF